MTAHTDPPNTHSEGADDEQLPCGRLLSQVWSAWEEQADDPHLHACPHCRSAVEDLTQLESAVRDLRGEPLDDTVHGDTAALTRRVMDVVRLELRPGRPLPLGEPDEDLWVMEAVAARTLRAAAETVPGVRAGSCRLRPLPGQGAPDRVEVGLEVHAPFDASLPDLAEDVRTRVWHAADRDLGMPVGAVDIRVTDLIDSTTDGQEGRAR
ncbi:Asp23/Gls24 family envelope stress response protein [Streptomyces endophyticus]|uniref:Asp23/Gls24 family envelope stress response protein n=1 Tax=Streptomyces endophyticus TaxID=714166 RepID=A0ABU6F0P2_9ACTN|nr:Asp23/Gls24 family envelope stress response protein [Streptomyces endophyticus]MEB8337569.1 Asp23/Gls24 family envelope stress response protein [Streptomyces endophyticus]